MFTPIHLLPQNASPDRWKYKERWDSPEGEELYENIIQRIRSGGGKHLLEADFQAGRLGFIEHEFDLRGFKVHGETITFPNADNFNAIDFSFSEFSNSTFINACFYCNMAFAKFSDCTFERCVFTFNHCYASMFENVKFVDCDFIEYDTFTNCLFSSTDFTNTFFPSNVFHDCRFDAETKFSSFPEDSVTRKFKGPHLEKSSKAELFREIGEAYASGGANQISRRFLFLHSHSLTRFNIHGWREKSIGYVSEYLTGYFLRPERPIFAMIVWFLFILCLFASQIDFRDAFLLSSGALFTFGAKADLLDQMSFIFLALYIVSSFIGISFTALFITVLANISIRQK